MFSLSSTETYFLYGSACDMRKGFNGLCGLVRNELNRDPVNGEVFVFLNRNRTHLKMLHWEHGGFVLYYKRLERGRFRRPFEDSEGGALKWHDLVLMVEGIQVKKQVELFRYSPLKQTEKR